jgi:hypothetical protein
LIRLTTKGLILSDNTLDIKPGLFERSFLKNWWVIVLGMVVGGLLGLVISSSLRPIYESNFIIISDVRISKSEDITEIMLDAAINHVGDLAYNPVVVERLEDAMTRQGVMLTFEMLIDSSSIERRLNATHLKVRWKDPNIAMQIANTWGLILYDILQDGYKQALIADDLTSYQATLETCLKDEDSTGCGTYCGLTKEALQAEITRLGNDIAIARNLSLGLYPELTVSQYKEADLAEKPAFYEQRSLILAGMGIGFLLSLLLLEVWLPKRKFKD